jgi:uncharacterized protein YwgA
MMRKLHEMVANLVELAGGELVGRIRFQKIVYLLDSLGLGSGATYTYYHYGPYSEELWDAVSDAKFFDGLREETAPLDGGVALYSVFKLDQRRPVPEMIGGLPKNRAREILTKLKDVNSTVLELASTIHWLAFVERVPDWRSEIELRKAGKTGQGRLERAVRVLKELDLSPPQRRPV